LDGREVPIFRNFPNRHPFFEFKIFFNPFLKKIRRLPHWFLARYPAFWAGEVGRPWALGAKSWASGSMFWAGNQGPKRNGNQTQRAQLLKPPPPSSPVLPPTAPPFLSPDLTRHGPRRGPPPRPRRRRHGRQRGLRAPARGRLLPALRLRAPLLLHRAPPQGTCSCTHTRGASYPRRARPLIGRWWRSRDVVGWFGGRWAGAGAAAGGRGAGAAADAGGGGGELRRLHRGVRGALLRPRAARGVRQPPRGPGNAGRSLPAPSTLCFIASTACPFASQVVVL
jgi:hypothetical protein